MNNEIIEVITKIGCRKQENVTHNLELTEDALQEYYCLTAGFLNSSQSLIQRL
jgi:hypothetical protein